MLIDWFTVVAQAINFLILVALLRWWLYKPVLQVMGRRQQALQEEWSAASTQLEAARASEAAFARKQQELDATRAQRLAELRHDLDRERQRLQAELRQEMASERQAWQRQLAQDLEASQQFLTEAVADQIVLAARQVLGDLANAQLEEQIVAVFCERLARIGPGTLARGGEPATAAVRVRTSFDLPPDQQRRLEDQLGQVLGGRPAVGYERTTELLCGIELRLPGQTVTWSVARYLEGLQERLAEALNIQRNSRDPQQRPSPAAGI
jgi:F-type H+-transporting ATPase subunit b